MTRENECTIEIVREYDPDEERQRQAFAILFGQALQDPGLAEIRDEASEEVKR